MKIATWNINSIRSRVQHLLDFIDEVNPDVLMLQELKCENQQFPYEELSHLPYNLYVHGQKSYNGVAILTKFRADEIIYNFPSNPLTEQSRFIEITAQTPIGFCRIICLYAPNGGEAHSDKFELKLQFFDAINNYLKSIKYFEEKIIIGGDFNICPFDIDVYSTQEFDNKTGFTLVERSRLRTLLNIGFDDQFRLLNPHLQEFSWWDYRGNAFAQNKGMRIDMILTSSNATTDFSKCYIDYATRTKIKPSDHAPVILH
ncbi:MAG: exodeoxyribonuclease III [Rickettsiaceae bacterium]|nr:MAG: exodeoxyribonuclease III [Rickettsiaceae bacterium]